jgi:PKHD-type hydroxylase
MMEHPNWLLYEGVLSEEDCERWLDLGRQAPIQDAKTFGGHDTHRKTDIRWLPNVAPYAEMHDFLMKVAMDANKQFNLTLTDLPPLQFTEYADVGHKYDMHHDVDFNRQDGKHRKLSIVVQLTDPDDYEGGILSFAHTQNPDPEALIKRGSIICFPSYLEHGVSPITSGSRTSLVGWFEGPRWR